MWFLIWFLLSAFVLGVFAWSLRILLQQKAAWKSYSDKMKLTYNKGPRFLYSPYLTGSIGPYGFALFTQEQITTDTRGQRYNTVLEIALRRGLPASGAMGTPAVMEFVEALRLDQSVSPQDADWDPTWIVRTRHAGMVEKYLTPARLETFKKIFRMKVVSAFMVFDREDAILRIETTDPLNNKDRLEKIVKGLLAQAEVLVVKPEEYAALDAIVQSSPPAPLPPLHDPVVEVTPTAALDDSADLPQP